jgi:pyruvate,water dikinase
MTTSSLKRITVPDNFAFEWPDPAMEALTWRWDQMHHPHPVTPLTATLEFPAAGEGSTRGFQALGMRVNFRIEALNGYGFNCMEQLEPGDGFPPPWWPEVEQQFLARLPGLRQSWENDYLPEVMAFNERLRDHDYGGEPVDGLVAFLQETRAQRARMWDLHMQTVIPVMGAATRFAGLCEQLLGAGGEQRAYLMLQGFENKTVESGKALWDLSRRAMALPGVAKVIEETPAAELAAALQGTAEGKTFWQELEGYLTAYGWRSDAFELADPAWVEDPSIAIHALREQLNAPDSASPALNEERSRQEREETVSEALAQLDGHEGKPVFEMMLGVAQQYLPVQENHNFYIDQMNTVLLRRPVLEAGRRLADQQALRERDDVFYLTYDELSEALGQPRSQDWDALVQERRAERERRGAIVPPRELGTQPDPADENPMTTAFFGRRPEASKDPKVINGIAAAAGTVTGPARVVRKLSEAGKVQAGDVLVCEMTMPAWTPLFASVIAVVADSGGVLSHCAIVAREYRIPCVVGTETGTQTLKDGQRVTVDGGQGVVRIEG